MARKLEVQIVGDTRGLERAFARASRQATGFGSRVQRTLGRVGKVAAFTAGAAGLGGLALTIRSGISEWKNNAKVAAQTEAVLKSTGKAAHVTAKDIFELGGDIQTYSGLSDETVRSGENLLLTFKDIHNEAGRGNDIFDQATRTMVDMSVALGQDMKQSAIQLGKALNDPIYGMTQLRRVGVSFTDAQVQQVKAMVAAGDTMKAQKLILAELNSEFAGSAEAIGKTLPGQLNVLKERFGDLSGQLVEEFLPALTRIVQWVNAHWGEISATMDAVFTAIRFAVERVLAPAIQAIITAGTATVTWFRVHWPTISRIAQTVCAAVKGYWDQVLKPVLVVLLQLARSIVRFVRVNWPTISRVIRVAFRLIKLYWDNILHPELTAMLAVFRGLVAFVSGAFHLVSDAVGAAANAIRYTWNNVLHPVLEAFRSLPGGIIGAFKTMGAAVGKVWQGMISTAIDALNRIIDAINVFIRAWNGLSIPFPDVSIRFKGFSVLGQHVGVPYPRIGLSHWSTPDIGELGHVGGMAKGGIVTRPTLAVIGERGPEAVVPLSRGGGYSGPDTIVVEIGGREIGRIVLEELRRSRKRNVALGLS